MKHLCKRILRRFGWTPPGAQQLLENLLRLRWIELGRYFGELRRYRRGMSRPLPIYRAPYLADRTMSTPLDKYYFYQDVWGAGLAMEFRPPRIVDVGSTALLVGIFAQIAETISVDIRPLPVELENLHCRRGSILDMPFEDAGVDYLNSLCVLEHIGLGRYGDPIDPEGCEKAAAELARVVAPGGRLVLSVPLGPSCIVFNGCRVFQREELLGLFDGFSVERETFLVPEPQSQDPTPEMRPGEYHCYCVCLRKGR
jgi:SAM-dependent methyltransferase